MPVRQPCRLRRSPCFRDSGNKPASVRRVLHTISLYSRSSQALSHGTIHSAGNGGNRSHRHDEAIYLHSSSYRQWTAWIALAPAGTGLQEDSLHAPRRSHIAWEGHLKTVIGRAHPMWCEGFRKDSHHRGLPAESYPDRPGEPDSRSHRSPIPKRPIEPSFPIRLFAPAAGAPAQRGQWVPSEMLRSRR